MKTTAKRLIEESEAKSNSYARIVLDALLKIDAIDSALIPTNSLIREFIGGGIYEELY
jgi:hypothetical protein